MYMYNKSIDGLYKIATMYKEVIVKKLALYVRTNYIERHTLFE